MAHYADPFVCPGCGGRTSLNGPRCPACRLDLRHPLAAELWRTLQTADDLLARLRTASVEQPAKVAVPAGAVPPPVHTPVPAQVKPVVIPPPVIPSPAIPPVVIPPLRADRSPRGLSSASVPRILLTLGALCLLVAAVIFLAVAWRTWLGVGGRTAVLVGFTVIAGGAAVVLGRRGLRVAAESMSTVSLGLLALDVVGADNAGWLGDLTTEWLAAAIGGTLLAAALPLGLSTRLVAPQLVAALGLSLLGGGVLGATGHDTVAPVAVIVGYAGLGAAGLVRRLPVLLGSAAFGAVSWWFCLLAVGLAEAGDHLSVHELWVDGHGVSLLLASLLVLLPVPFVRARLHASRALAAAAAVLLTATACLPAIDESATVFGTVALVALVAWTLVSLVTPVQWRLVPWVPMLVAAIPVFLVTGGLAMQAVDNAVGTHEPFTRTLATRLGDPDPVAAPVLLLLGAAGLLGAVLSVVPRVRLRVPAGVLLLAAIGVPALYPVPAWTVAGALVLLGAALVADGLRDEGDFGLGESIAGVGVASMGMVVALPSDVLTALVLAAIVALTGAMFRLGSVVQRLLGGLLLPAALAGFVWVACTVAGAEESITLHCVAALVALVGWTLVSLATPKATRLVPQLPMLVAAAPVVLVTASLAMQAVDNAVGIHDPFTRTVATRLGDPDPIAAPVLLVLGVAGLLGAVLSVLPRTRLQVPAGVLALAAIGLLALYPVPAWAVAGALTLLGAALVADALRDQEPFGLGESVAGIAVASLGVVVALPSDVLTALVLAALVALTGALFRRGSVDQRLLGGLLLPAALAGLVWVACGVAGAEESTTLHCVAALVALVGWILVSLATPKATRLLPQLPMLVAAVPVALVTSALAAQAAANAVGIHAPFTRTLATRLGDPDPIAAPVLLLLGAAGLLGAVLSVLPRTRLQVPAGVLALAAIGLLALYPVPAWAVAGALTLLGAALVADGLRAEGAFGFGESLTGFGVALLGVVVALPSDVLTAAVLAVLVALAATMHWYGWPEQQDWGGALLPVTLAGFVWVAGEAAGVDEVQRGVPILLLVGLLAIARPRLEIEVAAAWVGVSAAAIAIGFAENVSVALAVHLTIAGALVSATALIHPGRRQLGWVGGVLLAAATWVRLADLGVEAPEPYTLPTALALVVLGVVQLWRDPTAPTARALGPGLVLATIPSLLWVLVDPASARAVLLGLGCLGLVLVGVRLRWSAPLVVGAAVGAVLVLAELAPYAAAAPGWALIGIAGTVLTVVGITWEARMRDLRFAEEYLRRLQ